MALASTSVSYDEVLPSGETSIGSVNQNDSYSTPKRIRLQEGLLPLCALSTSAEMETEETVPGYSVSNVPDERSDNIDFKYISEG